MLPEQGERLEAFGGVTEELGLLGDHGNVVGRSIFKGEGEEALKAMGAVTYKSYVISLSNACHMDRTELHPQLGQLGKGKFRVVGEFIESITQDSPLLDPKKIVNRSHEAFVPLNKCFSVFQPIVEVNEALAITTCQIYAALMHISRRILSKALCASRRRRKRGLFWIKREC